MHKNNLIMNIQYYKTKTPKGKTNVAAFYHHNLKTKVIVPTIIYNYLLEKIEEIPEVINAYLVTGQSADFIVELVAKNMEDYSEILLRRIANIENVVALHSSFVIKKYDVFNCYNMLSRI
mgnify:CR=1 FL=1